MENDEFVCPICGEITSSWYGNYRKDKLCREHARELKNGIIEIDDDGLFINATSGEILNVDYDKSFPKAEESCIVCGKTCRKGHYQCRDCYYETKDYMDGIDANSSIGALRNHYYNLKDSIFRLRDGERVISKCNNLIAIALANEKFNDDKALISRVYKDVSYIIKTKSNLFEINDEDLIEEIEKNTPEEKTNLENTEKKTYYHYSSDGHALDSDMEIRIDDILYSNEIFHCCHKRVNEISERAVVSDWFIPIEGINKGIYIEYWGMDNAKYKQNKEEKIRLYKENCLPLIEIEKDEPKLDMQVFTGHLIAQIRDKAKEYFGAMPKWEKPKRK